MSNLELTGQLGKFPTGNLCNAHPEVRAMAAPITPLFQGASLCGRAKTALVSPGQNNAIHRAVHSAKRGDIIVVDAGGSLSFGPFGDLMTTCCLNQGIVGLVIDGAVRDSDEITEMGFPVFCLGKNPSATAKSERGKIDIEITCGGVRVRPGDYIVGDADGVVVIPLEIADEVAGRVTAVAAREEEIREELSNGKTTAQIFDLLD